VTRAQQSRTPEPSDEIVAALVAALASLEPQEPVNEPVNWRSALAPQPRWSETGVAAWRDADRRRGWRN
jgi:hypothetical protein